MLDLFFKKYAWTANLLLLFAGAWLCARTVNVVVGAAIRPRPTVDLSAVPAAPPRTAAPTTIDLDNLYKALGAEKPAPPPAAEEATAAAPKPKPQNCNDRSLAPARSALRAQLVAGVVADPPEYSIASITDLTTRETKVYGVGEQVLGAKILSIERLRDEKDGTGSGFKVVAILCNGGQKEFIDFDSGEPSSAFVTAPPPGAPAAPAAPVAEGGGNVPPGSVTKVSDNRYEVKRSFIDSTLSNLNNVATQARIVPSFKNGVANGFKLFSIQPGSLYQAIGVENGDVIQRINGYEINSPDKALEVYTKLRESSHITIEVERNGQTIRKEYNVTGS